MEEVGLSNIKISKNTNKWIKKRAKELQLEMKIIGKSREAAVPYLLDKLRRDEDKIDLVNKFLEDKKITFQEMQNTINQ